MNMEQSVCASSSQAAQWEQVDWIQCERKVSRLQARIVKATQAKRWNKVKALQRLLTCSFSGKALAVKRVTDNRGKRTPGVDGIIWNTPAAKRKAIGTLRRRGYPTRTITRFRPAPSLCVSLSPAWSLRCYVNRVAWQGE
jgi:RNA-directed DNA polymerase